MDSGVSEAQSFGTNSAFSHVDFDGPTAERALRASYEKRISLREGGHLSFKECIDRLDHSFLSVTIVHIAANNLYLSQHPSLRDMLLLHLRGDAGSAQGGTFLLRVLSDYLE